MTTNTDDRTPHPFDREIGEAADQIQTAARQAMWAALQAIYPDHDWLNLDGVPAAEVRDVIAAHKAHLATPAGRDESKLQQLAACAIYTRAFGPDAAQGNVANARLHGATWAEIGQATNLTRQGAQQRWGAGAAEYLDKCRTEYAFAPEPIEAED